MCGASLAGKGLTNIGQVGGKLEVVDELRGDLSVSLEAERQDTTVGVGSEELLGEFV